MSPNRIICKRSFKPLLCKFGEFVQAFESKSGNSTDIPRTYCALYLHPNINGSGHMVYKIITKQKMSTVKCIPMAMTQIVKDAINKSGELEEMPDGIEFYDVDGMSTLEDLYPDDVNEDDSCASDRDWKIENEKDMAFEDGIEDMNSEGMDDIDLDPDEVDDLGEVIDHRLRSQAPVELEEEESNDHDEDYSS